MTDRPPLYNDRRWERCMWAAILALAAGCWVAVAGLFGVAGVVELLVVCALVAAAFAQGVGA